MFVKAIVKDADEDSIFQVLMEREVLPVLAQRGVHGIPRLVHASESLAITLLDGSKCYFIITEPVGECLSARAKSDPNGVRMHLPSIALDCALILYKLHHAGYIHCDVCPANIIMINGRARLTDFGCALSLSLRVEVGQRGSYRSLSADHVHTLTGFRWP